MFIFMDGFSPGGGWIVSNTDCPVDSSDDGIISSTTLEVLELEDSVAVFAADDDMNDDDDDDDDGSDGDNDNNELV